MGMSVLTVLGLLCWYRQSAGFRHELNPEVLNVLQDVVNLGVSNVRDIRMVINNYVSRRMFPGQSVKKLMMDKRYYPTKVDVVNFVKRSILTNVDKESLEKFVAKWQQSILEDFLFFRPHKINTEIPYIPHPRPVHRKHLRMVDLEALRRNAMLDSGDPLLLCYQSVWQKRLLSIYGNQLCFLDPAYRMLPCIYPLYFLVVPTNVGCMIVGVIVLEKETPELLSEALRIFRNWNPTWKPAQFMVGVSEMDANVIQALFKGSRLCINDEHCKKVWLDWGKDETDGIEDKSAILKMMESIAEAPNREKLKKALEDFHESDEWKRSERLQNWFIQTWERRIKQWTVAYRDKTLDLVLKSGHIAEAWSGLMEHKPIRFYRNSPLNEMITAILKKYLPKAYNKYTEMNTDSSQSNELHLLPNFLKNSPAVVIQSMIPIAKAANGLKNGRIIISENEAGLYHLELQPKQMIEVRVGGPEKMPSCTCEQWKTTKLPCIHFFALIKFVPEMTWESISSLYRECVLFKTDWECKSVVAYTVGRDEESDNDVEESEAEALGADESDAEDEESDNDADYAYGGEISDSPPSSPEPPTELECAEIENVSKSEKVVTFVPKAGLAPQPSTSFRPVKRCTHYESLVQANKAVLSEKELTSQVSTEIATTSSARTVPLQIATKQGENKVKKPETELSSKVFSQVVMPSAVSLLEKSKTVVTDSVSSRPHSGGVMDSPEISEKKSVVPQIPLTAEEKAVVTMDSNRAAASSASGWLSPTSEPLPATNTETVSVPIAVSAETVSAPTAFKAEVSMEVDEQFALQVSDSETEPESAEVAEILPPEASSSVPDKVQTITVSPVMLSEGMFSFEGVETERSKSAEPKDIEAPTDSSSSAVAMGTEAVSSSKPSLETSSADTTKDSDNILDSAETTVFGSTSQTYTVGPLSSTSVKLPSKHRTVASILSERDAVRRPSTPESPSTALATPKIPIPRITACTAAKSMPNVLKPQITTGVTTLTLPTLPAPSMLSTSAGSVLRPLSPDRPITGSTAANAQSVPGSVRQPVAQMLYRPAVMGQGALPISLVQAPTAVRPATPSVPVQGAPIQNSNKTSTVTMTQPVPQISLIKPGTQPHPAFSSMMAPSSDVGKTSWVPLQQFLSTVKTSRVFLTPAPGTTGIASLPQLSTSSVTTPATGTALASTSAGPSSAGTGTGSTSSVAVEEGDMFETPTGQRYKMVHVTLPKSSLTSENLMSMLSEISTAATEEEDKAPASSAATSKSSVESGPPKTALELLKAQQSASTYASKSAASSSSAKTSQSPKPSILGRAKVGSAKAAAEADTKVVREIQPSVKRKLVDSDDEDYTPAMEIDSDSSGDESGLQIDAPPTTTPERKMIETRSRAKVPAVLKKSLPPPEPTMTRSKAKQAKSPSQITGVAAASPSVATRSGSVKGGTEKSVSQESSKKLSSTKKSKSSGDGAGSSETVSTQQTLATDSSTTSTKVPTPFVHSHNILLADSMKSADGKVSGTPSSDPNSKKFYKVTYLPHKGFYAPVTESDAPTTVASTDTPISSKLHGKVVNAIKKHLGLDATPSTSQSSPDPFKISVVPISSVVTTHIPSVTTVSTSVSSVASTTQAVCSVVPSTVVSQVPPKTTLAHSASMASQTVTLPMVNLPGFAQQLQVLPVVPLSQLSTSMAATVSAQSSVPLQTRGLYPAPGVKAVTAPTKANASVSAMPRTNAQAIPQAAVANVPTFTKQVPKLKPLATKSTQTPCKTYATVSTQTMYIPPEESKKVPKTKRLKLQQKNSDTAKHIIDTVQLVKDEQYLADLNGQLCNLLSELRQVVSVGRAELLKRPIKQEPSDVIQVIASGPPVMTQSQTVATAPSPSKRIRLDSSAHMEQVYATTSGNAVQLQSPSTPCRTYYEVEYIVPETESAVSTIKLEEDVDHSGILRILDALNVVSQEEVVTYP